LKKIENAELFLASLGFHDVRVRIHADNLVRLELSVNDIALASEHTMRTAIHDRFRSFGFDFVTLDLMGRQSGSLNRVLPIIY
jgi:uncharacterized protein